jgi:predicted Zn-dependent protease
MQFRSQSILIACLILTVLSALCCGQTTVSKAEIRELEDRVKALLEQSNVSRRSGIDDVFRLADIYHDQGKTVDAIMLYKEGLKVDPWRLEHQIKLAKILADRNDKEAGIEKAQLVYTYAEDESLIRQAEKLLAELGQRITPPSPGDAPRPDARMRIMLVRIGNVNDTLLEEVRAQLEKKMEIRYDICPRHISGGKIDRSYAARWIDSLFQRIRASEPQANFERLLGRMRLKEKDLDTYEGKKSLVQYYLRLAVPEKEFIQFCEQLAEEEKQGQRDASRLIVNLRRHFSLKSDDHIKGYLGVTEEDIYSEDFNFLFGLGSPGFAVMSYHRFSSDFDQSKPNRPRLVLRSVKQCISSSFHIFEIPRCTMPTCARAYPNDLEEHDRKNNEICSGCKKRLVKITDNK